MALTETDKRTALKAFVPGMPPFSVAEATITESTRYNLLGIWEVVLTPAAQLIEGIVDLAKRTGDVALTISSSIVNLIKDDGDVNL